MLNTRLLSGRFYYEKQDYITWDEYFMGIAVFSAMRSKDSSTQVGACIVNEDKRIISIGYNGMPNGCHDDCMPWGRDGDPLETKYPFVCHAELNAILNSNGRSLKMQLPMSLYFLVMNVLKLLFKVESAR